MIAILIVLGFIGAVVAILAMRELAAPKSHVIVLRRERIKRGPSVREQRQRWLNDRPSVDTAGRVAEFRPRKSPRGEEPERRYPAIQPPEPWPLPSDDDPGPKAA